MKRRQAIQSIGGVFGYTIAAPAVLSLLQGCEGKAYAQWMPDFFEENEGQLVARMLDVILPETDTPKATEVGVHQFIDQLFYRALPALEQEIARYTTALFMDRVRALTGKQELKEVTDEEIVQVLNIYLARLSPEVEEAQGKVWDKYYAAVEDNQPAELDPEIGSFIWAREMRNLAIKAYRESERIGRKVLVYKPIPGEYIPCGDLEELTGGLDYSIPG